MHIDLSFLFILHDISSRFRQCMGRTHLTAALPPPHHLHYATITANATPQWHTTFPFHLEFFSF
jgi:hypothetical protein